jgi:hypothetical protein
MGYLNGWIARVACVVGSETGLVPRRFLSVAKSSIQFPCHPETREIYGLTLGGNMVQ